VTVSRVTQEVVESVSQVTATSRVTQEAVEVVSANALRLVTSQVCVEMVSESVPDDDDEANRPIMFFIAT